MLEQHSHLEYFDSGLHINPSFLHLGATPDGVINCDCCGRGLIDIKCPFKHREKHPHEITDPNFYLMRTEKFIYVMTTSITTKYRVSLLCAIWSIVTSFAGLHVACIVNEFSQIQNISLTSQSQHSMNFLLLFCSLDYSLVHPPLWRNLQPKTMLLLVWWRR